MSSTFFECKKCGACCRNLFDDSCGITVGMFLTPEETALFDRSLVSPFYAFGVNNPKKIISYQLNVDECPHINGNNECKIYDRRPLTCRAFPVEILDATRNTISRRCPTISSMIKEGEVSEDIKNLDNEIDVASKMYRWRLNRIPKYLRKGLTLFWFDLKTKKWVVPKINHFEQGILKGSCAI